MCNTVLPFILSCYIFFDTAKLLKEIAILVFKCLKSVTNLSSPRKTNLILSSVSLCAAAVASSAKVLHIKLDTAGIIFATLHIFLWKDLVCFVWNTRKLIFYFNTTEAPVGSNRFCVQFSFTFCKMQVVTYESSGQYLYWSTGTDKLTLLKKAISLSAISEWFQQMLSHQRKVSHQFLVLKDQSVNAVTLNILYMLQFFHNYLPSLHFCFYLETWHNWTSMQQ